MVVLTKEIIRFDLFKRELCESDKSTGVNGFK